jgi:hypothetical protein
MRPLVANATNLGKRGERECCKQVRGLLHELCMRAPSASSSAITDRLCAMMFYGVRGVASLHYRVVIIISIIIIIIIIRVISIICVLNY